ncbi:integrase core domain-containing protein [Nonomuraea insulae]|uniref:Integrase core domain-containing protein n=1 Tax=Nonomuraea insulae TaxID=1616787 RepID=A0ABW1D777_9ACTN
MRQKNSTPNHPTTCGKVERFQQTMKNWLRAQPIRPATLTDLQALLNRFCDTYSHHRPHRSLPHRATPAAAYTAAPKALPDGSRDADTHAPRPPRPLRRRHPVRERPAALHRRRTNPRPDPRHSPDRRPARPRRRRHHRRTSARADHRPGPRLPTPGKPQQDETPGPVGSRVSDVLRHHKVPPAGFGPAFVHSPGPGERSCSSEVLRGQVGGEPGGHGHLVHVVVDPVVVE